MTNNAYVVLANGHVFEGKSFGATGSVTGEIVFSTSMTGYLETLTNPSNYGQIIVQTFPLAGNYGIIPADFESEKSHLGGYIVREVCDAPSNFRCQKGPSGTLDHFLQINNVIGLYGIDTRRLTKIIRQAGAMNARILSFSGNSEKDSAIMHELKKLGIRLESSSTKYFVLTPTAALKNIRTFKNINGVRLVSRNAKKIEKSAEYVFEESSQYHAVPLRADGLKANDLQQAMASGSHADGSKKNIVIWDFGAKANIRRELLKRGVDVVSLASTTTAHDILALKPDGVVLSNGPGNPADNVSIIAEITSLCNTCPKNLALFGIGLGHQLLALARGASVEKLQYGHHGTNQPVKKLKTGRVYISSQNHRYTVLAEKLPADLLPSFKNVNDQTIEGLDYSSLNAFSVQFHPEASPGPLDTGFLFDDFIKRIQNH